MHSAAAVHGGLAAPSSGAAGLARQRLRHFMQQHRHCLEELEQRWQRLEARLTALANGVGITQPGQVLPPPPPLPRAPAP